MITRDLSISPYAVEICPGGTFFRNNQLYILSNGTNGNPCVYKMDKDAGLTYHSSLELHERVLAMDSDGQDRAAFAVKSGILVFQSNADLSEWVSISRISCQTNNIIGLTLGNSTVVLTGNKGQTTTLGLYLNN